MELGSLFKPDKVAVVGASREEGKTGHEVFDNLLHDFEGEVVPVNPNAEEVHGEKALDETPPDTDLVVVAVPGKIVPDVLEDAGEKGVNAAVVISAGFSETGNEQLEKEVLETCEENDIALLGPNVLGLINTENSMNASFASKMPSQGSISFMSQSGAFCTAILDYAKASHIGFRHFVSLGNKAMLNEVDFLDHWLNDEAETILGYTEGIENGREFMELARKVSQEKPVVMIKSGRSDKGGAAASSHTGSIAGSYEAYKAAFRQSGIIEAESNRELLDYGRAFDYQPLPSGKSVAIVTNAGGPGVVTTDEVEEHGLELASLSMETIRVLREEMPEEASPGNPMDVIGDAGHERYKNALEAVLEDGNVDSVIVILTPQANTEIEKTAKTVAKIAGEYDKPVMASFMGEQDVEKGARILEERKVPDFEDPMDAVKVLEQMNRYQEFLERGRTIREVDYEEKKAREALENYEDFMDGEQLLKAYGFNIALTELAPAPKDAVEVASNVGYPVVMKVDSPDISHKTDIGAVETGVESKKEVGQKFHDIVDSVHHNASGSKINGVLIQEELDGVEIALGLKRDPQFGPMVMVGLGGIYIEVLQDVSFGIAPVSEEEAELMIEELRSHELFEGSRNQDVSMESVKDAIIRLGEIGLNHEEIRGIDLNPVVLKGENAYVTDIEIELEE